MLPKPRNPIPIKWTPDPDQLLDRARELDSEASAQPIVSKFTKRRLESLTKAKAEFERAK
jgi:hypothetical protein